ncbi:hypothetical protein M422DRAFT_30786, partial [Sphaerobolus stellatus SS14]
MEAGCFLGFITHSAAAFLSILWDISLCQCVEYATHSWKYTDSNHRNWCDILYINTYCGTILSSHTF